MSFGMEDKAEQTHLPWEIGWILKKLQHVNGQYPIFISQDNIQDLSNLKNEISKCGHMLVQLRHTIDSKLYNDVKEKIFNTGKFMDVAIMERVNRGNFGCIDASMDIRHLGKSTPLLKRFSGNYRSRMQQLRERIDSENHLAEKYCMVLSRYVFPESW